MNDIQVVPLSRPQLAEAVDVSVRVIERWQRLGLLIADVSDRSAARGGAGAGYRYSSREQQIAWILAQLAQLGVSVSDPNRVVQLTQLRALLRLDTRTAYLPTSGTPKACAADETVQMARADGPWIVVDASYPPAARR